MGDAWMKKIILGIGVMIVTLSYLLGISYYKQVFQEMVDRDEEEKIYKYQLDMIVENPKSTFWQAVYKRGKEEAEKNDAILELKGFDGNDDFDKLDYMKMSIAAQTDGIILEYKGEPGLDKIIDTAVDSGIPVITVMSDAPYTKRQSFVGITEYQLGIAYAEQICNYVNDDTRRIMVFQRKNSERINQSTICAEISKQVIQKTGSLDKVRVEEKNLLSLGTFEVEETVRDIFQREEGPPDIIVCMDEETTECARQALLDYNMAGKVTIIGYYTSESVLEGISKGIIAVTCDISTEQMGCYSVNALTEYLNEGRANAYYNVDIEFVDQEKVNRKKKENVDEEISMEESFLIQ